MATRPAVIDADGHIVERIGEIREFLGPPYRDLTQVWGDAAPFYPTLDGWCRGFSSPGKRDNADAAAWLSFLDDCGIERTVLYPTAALASGLIQDRELADDVKRKILHDNAARLYGLS